MDTLDSSIFYEKEFENFLELNPSIIEPGLTIIARQKYIKIRHRKGYIDLLARDLDGKYVIIELKRNKGDDNTLKQTIWYMGAIKIEFNIPSSHIRGIIVCIHITDSLRISSGVMDNLKLVELPDIASLMQNSEFKEFYYNAESSQDRIRKKRQIKNLKTRERIIENLIAIYELSPASFKSCKFCESNGGTDNNLCMACGGTGVKNTFKLPNCIRIGFTDLEIEEIYRKFNNK